ncbi:DUF1987 domain-containing protein [Paracrocinitomix mangrovi]|uniref:DUF1987 domain-containing protein n=1 Tax=Paracrocinitomix mangrovi TaxID=2862509 RepID=UPI001C8CFFDE|nr:DUF1987 domain-containing protein [Paracrocinitomix mangrovi]UKN01610.1 DUF1987 domain-containing protein [Paracrocinitomix mangrovi]
MERLIIEATEDTPSIDFDPGTNNLKISGRSLPEDVTKFYQPVLDWLDELEASSGNDCTLHVGLEYFNTASSKLILDILMKLEDIHMDGNNTIKVIWSHDARDVDMQEAAEEYSELVEVPFEVVAV